MRKGSQALIASEAVPRIWHLIGTGLLAWFLLSVQVWADVTPFIGEYKGSAELVNADGTTQARDMSVQISETKDGFNVSWSTLTYRPDGRTKEQKYSIDFLPTDRDGVFSAAMTRNVFGHAVPLDPMRGEPFVWGQIVGDTLTVYSLFVDEAGGYDLQQFDRTLVDGGLMLDFSRIHNGDKSRTVNTLLERQ